MNKIEESSRTPWWIYLILGITVLSSAVGVYGGYFDGTTFYSEFESSLWSSKLVQHLAGMWASKNVGLIAVLIIALLRKHYQALAYLFLFKFITDSIDILVINTLYRDGAAEGIMTNVISWIILGLTSLLAYFHFMKRG